ncbi:hypothetical protein J31TS4_29130 [Paenibacillus sp. J31TS4]|uniref:lytic transglycosylase domain-containing protein n=1 Tax=Paenibacillus sp. J31TS4 TaxID=2807195 RepID=UPI001B16362C|nr:lytic transglycosylase domain-containing protein [Paenibacillus sp. J31TS4]GIP39633.1 hypothetical protein J31TS4_29130 [Paenibacillus sp. J31TS4]
MAVSIDPRLMKQMLQLQMYGQRGLLVDPSAEVSDSPAALFSMLLDQMQGGAGTVRAQTAAEEGRPLVQAPVPESAYVPAPLLAKTAAWAAHPALSKPSSYEKLIEEAGSRHGVDPALIKGVIATESSFNPYAQSSAGAKGLMQLMDGTARGFGVTDSFDPQQNIEAGTKFLAGLLAKYKGNEGVALAAYNAGPGRVDRLGISDDASLKEKLSTLPKETQAYIGKVMNAKQSYT